MAHKKDPAFPLYASEWLSKRTVRRLSAEQRGVLVDLWAIAWTDGPIPDEDVPTLARQFGTAPEIVTGLLVKFFVADAAGWTSERLEAERQERTERIAKYRQAAEKTNAKRWGGSDRLATREANRLATREGVAEQRSPGGRPHLTSPHLSTEQQQQGDVPLAPSEDVTRGNAVPEAPRRARWGVPPRAKGTP